MTGEIDEWTQQIHTADLFDAVPAMPAESVHAVVTDPPYGLAFMGRDWDDFEPTEYQEWCEEWAREVKRVLKPGGHLLAFSGNRTHHRLFTGAEDAGFEIRDTLTWHYGSGFPKATDVSKTIDKREGAERTEGKRVWKGGDREGGDWSNSDRRGEGTTEKVIYDEPATDDAKEWDGWKTGLKPATEYVVMARKPFDGATVDCVLEHGTGALNIDGTRVEGDVDTTRPDGPNNPEIYGPQTNDNRGSETGGRYPSNVVFDETAAADLDEQVGELSSGELTPSSANDVESTPATNCYGEFEGRDLEETYEANSGGPSRYFYTSKASKSERTMNGKIDNAHPTVKPQDLMEWLIRLVTRKDQIVLDPFAGSGTTCKAAKETHRQFVGIERQEQWADVARARAGLTPEDPTRFGDEEQRSVSEWFE